MKVRKLIIVALACVMIFVLAACNVTGSGALEKLEEYYGSTDFASAGIKVVTTTRNYLPPADDEGNYDNARWRPEEIEEEDITGREAFESMQLYLGLTPDEIIYSSRFGTRLIKLHFENITPVDADQEIFTFNRRGNRNGYNWSNIAMIERHNVLYTVKNNRIVSVESITEIIEVKYYRTLSPANQNHYRPTQTALIVMNFTLTWQS
jgi:hypothetical protein